MAIRLIEVISLLNEHDLDPVLHGDDLEFSEMSAASAIKAGTLICSEDEQHLNKINDPTPVALVTSPALAESLKDQLPTIGCNHVSLAHTLIRLAFFDDHFDLGFAEGIHPTAVIDDTARIPSDAAIGPHVVIGANVIMGNHAQIAAQCTIGNDTQIGEHCRLFPNTTIGPWVRLGDRVIIKAGSTIGGEGFGFVSDEHHNHHRLPHQGGVSIADDVVVGAGCNIDCATYGETRIGKGTRLDAHCHIAHNVCIGENCLIVAQTGIGGSATIGDRVVVSGQAAISDHKTVGNDVTLVHRAGVTQDITEPGVYASTPTQPIKNYLRNIAIFQKLSDLRNRVARLEKKQKSGPR